MKSRNMRLLSCDKFTTLRTKAIISKEPLHSVCIAITTPQSQQREYLTIIEKALAVDRQIDEVNVRKEITHSEDGISIKISTKQLKLLRSCVTGLLRHARLVAETIKQFKDTP